MPKGNGDTMKLKIFLFLFVLPASLWAATIGGTPGEVQAAINSAAPGGSIIIRNGSYTWSSGITCNKAVHIKGESAGGVTITGNNITATLFSLTENKDGNM